MKKNKKILIVDSDVSFRESLRVSIKQLGPEVLDASSVEERAERVLDAGAAEIIFEPFRLSVLRDVLRTHLPDESATAHERIQPQSHLTAESKRQHKEMHALSIRRKHAGENVQAIRPDSPEVANDNRRYRFLGCARMDHAR